MFSRPQVAGLGDFQRARDDHAASPGDIADKLPEARSSAFGDATVQQRLDMRASLCGQYLQRHGGL